MFAEVALSISTFQSFTYKIPHDLIHISQIGCRVKVPLGNRIAYGVIISINDASGYKGEFKSISEIIDDVPILTKELWKLIHWISYYYVTPFGKVFNTVLPINISKNYSPQTYWYAKYVEGDDEILIGKLKKNAKVQYNVYLKIKQTSPMPMKVSSLKSLCSNPLSICQSLEKKRLIGTIKRDAALYILMHGRSIWLQSLKMREVILYQLTTSD